ncbi:hypothetical protein TWF173_003295 [Orbilia oligospora]|nr:hypothetical protein TWF173_003295 [Orbilia oligospora]
MPIVPMLRLRSSPQNRLIRRLLFATIFFLLNAHLFIYFLHSPNEEASDDLASLWDYNPAVTVPRVHGIGKVYIAANHWISGKILKPYWINGLLMLIQQLGPENVFVSIYENGSWDETPAMLRELDRELERMGVERRVLIEAITHREQVAEVVAQGDDKPGWVMTSRGMKELRRIPMLAKLRNRLLEPLEELQRQGKGNFDRILFMNDVVFTAEDVITLLRTRDGNYSAACSVDFNKPQYYYDTFALRDIYGQEAASQRFPFFASGESRNAMMRGDPVPVQSCWNGIVAFDAAPFTRQQKPLRFRGIDDSLSVLHLEGSECSSIIAVIQGINGCWKIYSGIKDAKSDIDSLSVEVANINGLVERVGALIRDPKFYGLSENKDLAGALEGCQNELRRLQSKLDSQKEHSRLSLFKRTKWPFAKTGVVETINNLERWKGSINVFLNVDQTDTIRNVNQKFDLAGLLIAETAAYGNFADRHEPECLPSTRVELRKRIEEWVDAPRGAGVGECIFWLSGVAGTGKSTISRTTAKELREKGQLAASFFFRRGEKDRGGAARLFTTLASQLANNIVDVRRNIQKAIETDPNISSMGPGEQFTKLILQPLRDSQEAEDQSRYDKIIIVIDALDECDEEKDQRLIISLLSQLKDLKQFDVRIFLTSRPELPIRLGFKDLSKGIHKNVILHEESGTDRDIGILLNDEFSKVRKARDLPSDWPGQDIIQKLVEIAVPLFIFAATACRFIADENWDPQEQVKLVMESQTDLSEDVEKTYTPILKRLIENQKSIALKRLESEFRQIVGTIVNLASPLSVPSLARLLSVSETTIDLRLKKLHSVLNIPGESSRHEPVRTFHLSFRDFLISQHLHGHAELSRLWIDVKKTHGMLATRCIELMSNTEGLKQDICCLNLPGIFRSEIDEETIQKQVSPELQYACRNWVYHRTQSEESICDDDIVHTFLDRSLLHWLEVESLLGDMENTIQMINNLKMITDALKGKKLLALLYDIKRFLLQNKYIIAKAPLQTYVSAIMFAPEESLVRKLFSPEKMIPWVRQSPRVQKTWDPLLQTLEGHRFRVLAVAFFDGIIASVGAADYSVKLWNANTGAALRTIWDLHFKTIIDLAFSPNGILASTSKEEIKMWNTDTGELIRNLKGHTAIAFAPNSSGILASGSDDGTVRLWDADWTLRRTLEGHANGIKFIAFSDCILASASGDGEIRLWDIDGVLLHVLESSTYPLKALAFSSDGLLVLGLWNGTVKLWDKDGNFLQSLEKHTSSIRAVGFYKELVVSIAGDSTIKLWDRNGALLRTLKGYGFDLRTLVFTSDGILVGGCDDGTIRLWDLNEFQLWVSGERTDEVRDVSFSPDGKILASTTIRERCIKLWSEEGELVRTIKPHKKGASAMAFSLDGRVLASGSEDGIKIWSTDDGSLLRTFINSGSSNVDLVLSSDGRVLVSSTCRGGVEVWSLDGELLQSWIKGSITEPILAISFDGKFLASTIFGRLGGIGLWNVASESLLWTSHGHTEDVGMAAFSSDDKILLSASYYDLTVRLWDVGTGKPLETYADSADLLEFISDTNINTVNLWDARTLARLRTFAVGRLDNKKNQRHERVEQSHIIVEGEWLSRGRNRIWLPPDYRSLSFEIQDRTWDICGDRVALGHRSGQVSLIGFKS